ncbi:unnamed protein product [Rhodiola kirilowii]
MLKVFNFSLRRLCRSLRWPIRRRSATKVSIKRFHKTTTSLVSKPHSDTKLEISSNGSPATVYPNPIPNNQLGDPKSEKPIRVATFNAALFSMAPAVLPNSEFGSSDFQSHKLKSKSVNDRPKSILKQSPLHSSSLTITNSAKSKLRVSINLPDNEISLLKNYNSSFREGENGSSTSTTISRILRPKTGPPVRPTVSFSARVDNCRSSGRTVVDVLRELGADILALQDVKAEEEKGMKPLSDLAEALGMHYVFAESWAPEYGNAILSKWPIKKSQVLKIFDDSDFRNVLKATIDVPETGEVNFHCTLLDHLDESWRMKQINAIIQSNDEPHILAGGLNSLDETDYSQERWTDIIKYYEEMGKPTPRAEVMRFMKSRQYIDAKDFAGDCEPVVMIAKGQSVQGTCKYGTRVDYIMASPNSPYEFVPGSYSVLSSKGTSDHHIVKVDVLKKSNNHRSHENGTLRRAKEPKQRIVKINASKIPQQKIYFA